MECQDDELTEKIIGCIIKVHPVLGPGFLESIYRRALRVELRNQGLPAETEKEYKIYYESEEVGAHRVDIIVVGKVIVETKTVRELDVSHYDQLRSYLKATGLHVGLLANFARERAEYRRVEF